MTRKGFFCSFAERFTALHARKFISMWFANPQWNMFSRNNTSSCFHMSVYSSHFISNILKKRNTMYTDMLCKAQEPYQVTFVRKSNLMNISTATKKCLLFDIILFTTEKSSNVTITNATYNHFAKSIGCPKDLVSLKLTEWVRLWSNTKDSHAFFIS